MQQKLGFERRLLGIQQGHVEGVRHSQPSLVVVGRTWRQDAAGNRGASLAVGGRASIDRRWEGRLGSKLRLMDLWVHRSQTSFEDFDGLHGHLAAKVWTD